MKIKSTLLQKIFCFSVFTKAFALKKGSLAVASAPISFGLLSVFKKITENINYNDIALPIIVIIFFIIVYFVFFIIDFISGLVASKHESNNNPDWVKSNKLYDSLGKVGGVLLVNFLLLSIIMFIVIIGFINTSIVFLILTVSVNTVAILYELHSIGENQKRRTGKKSKYFSFFDRLTTVVESKIINRISRTIDPKGDDYPQGEG